MAALAYILTVFTSIMSETTNSAPMSTLPGQCDVEKVPGDDGSPESGSPEIRSSREHVQPSIVDEEAEPQRQVTGFRWLLVCLAIFSGNILYGLDTTIAADIQAAISEAFNNVSQLGWLGVGFTLGSTVTIYLLAKYTVALTRSGYSSVVL